MKTNKIIIELSKSELKSLIKESFNEFQETKENGFQNEAVLSAKEAAAYLNISLPTLHKWKKEGIVPVHKKGGRIFFKKSELYNCISK